MAIRRPYEYGLPDGAAKRHDDPQVTRWTLASQMRRCSGTLRRRRIVLALLAVWLLYLFIKNIPTDLTPVRDRFDSRYGHLGFPAQPSSAHPYKSLEEEYDGPVRFFKLGPSLRTFLSEPADQSNVLFAFANIHSASAVVTAACTMAAHNRSRVHVATLGKEDVALEHVLQINGISLADCPVRWHNAQVDFAAQSSSLRLARGIQGAFGHMQRALSLNAVFFDDSRREEDYMRSALAKAARTAGVAAIQLPLAESWMLALGGNSLRYWKKLQIDIIIRVQPESAGSLIRLLRGLQSADYGELSLPRIVLDLPPRTDPHILEHIQGFVWPPGSPTAESKLIIRHRVDDNVLSHGAASVQAVESFYPIDPDSSHLLVLSPSVELARNFYQLLVYLVLEYRYSQPAAGLADNLMGVSLLNTLQESDRNDPVVLSQSLHGEAALFFGDKWAEMHQYLSLRLMADPQLSSVVEPDRLTDKQEATWVKLATEMMRAQGYVMLYPRASDNGSALAVLHTELQQPPEEQPDQEPAPTEVLDLGTEKGALTAKVIESEFALGARALSRASLLTLLNSDQSRVAPLHHIPLISHQGKPIDTRTLQAQAIAYARQLAVNVGGCPPSQPVEPGDLGLLFC